MTAGICRLIEQVLSGFLLLGIFRRMKNRSALMKIKVAQGYVLGVKKTRSFFLGALFVSIAFVLLINGLILLQSAFFTYSTWSAEVRFYVAIGLGSVEFLGATGILYCLFREETWSRFAGIQGVINSVIDKKLQE